MQTRNNSLSKYEEDKDLCAVLLDCRIWLAKDMASPAEMLLDQKLRSFLPSFMQTVNNSLSKYEEENKDIFVVLLGCGIALAKDMASPAEMLVDRKLKLFSPSHTKQLDNKFNVENARVALKKSEISQWKYANV